MGQCTSLHDDTERVEESPGESPAGTKKPSSLMFNTIGRPGSKSPRSKSEAPVCIAAPLLTVDRDGLIVDVNLPATDFFSCSAAELQGRRICDFVTTVTDRGSACSSKQTPRGTPTTTGSLARISDGPVSGSGTPSSTSSLTSFRRLKRAASLGTMGAYLPARGAKNPWTGGRARISDGHTVPVLLAATSTPKGFSILLQDLSGSQTARGNAIAYDRKERLRDDRSRFVAYLSHEIRVPMNALSLGIGLLSNHDDSESSSVALQEHCSDLTACCDAVLHLLEDVLAMEQMQSGQYRYDFGPVDLVAVAIRTESMARMGLHRSTALRFQQSLAPELAAYRVWCDRNRITQAVSNFMSNAIRHANAGGSVRLSVSWEWRKQEESKKTASDVVEAGDAIHSANAPTESEGEGGEGIAEAAENDDDFKDLSTDDTTSVDGSSFWDDHDSDEVAREFFGAPAHALPVNVTIQVWNSGSRLAPRMEEAVFRPYTNVGGENDSANRTGIGLSITREIVCSGHGGSVKAWSDDSGTTFSATLRVFAVPSDPRINAEEEAKAKAKAAAAVASAAAAAAAGEATPAESTDQLTHAVSTDATRAGDDLNVEEKLSAGVSVQAENTVDTAQDETSEPVEMTTNSTGAASFPIPVNEDATDVLYIEDSQMNRKMLKRTLSRMGVSCDLAEDGREGVDYVERAEGRGYRVVLVDRAMPVMDGLVATRLMRAAYPNLPIIGLTGDAQPQEIETFIDAGANLVLTKPCDRDELKACLEKFLGRPLGSK